jgi:iron complex transport system substrate-binding protein
MAQASMAAQRRAAHIAVDLALMDGDRRCGKWLWLLLVWLLAVAPWPQVQAEVRVRDDSGHRVTLVHPARRIISLAPSITELLFAVGAGGRLVGTIGASQYPPAARAIPRVGRYDALDLETIVALRPDLVVAWGSGSPRGQVARLAALGIPVYRSESHSLADVAGAMRRLARLAGTEAQARPAIDAYLREYRRLAKEYSGRGPVRVFYQIWNRPLMTVNGRHLISHVIRLCGGRNVFADARGLTPQVGIEAVLARDPQVIVASGIGGRRPPWLADWKRWSSLQAVRNGQLYYVPADLINQATPRILQGAQRLCRQLQRARAAGATQ